MTADQQSETQAAFSALPIHTETLRPFLKWAGGKRQLLPDIRALLPARFQTYYEPFLGGGAVLFDLQPPVAVVNDLNSELINCYETIRDALPELIAQLRQAPNESAFFYQLRALDRESNFSELPAVVRAARILYLNKTCFNGLFRVNSKGHFNVPFGRYKNPKILDIPLLQAVSNYLNSNQITFRTGDYQTALHSCRPGDFVYLDPPYDPVSATASFTSYSSTPFGREAQVHLKETVDHLTRKGCAVLLSNAATDFIRELYADYTILTVACSRNINAVGSKRGKVAEVLILNYTPETYPETIA